MAISAASTNKVAKYHSPNLLPSPITMDVEPGIRSNASNVPKVISSIKTESAVKSAHSAANLMLLKVFVKHAIKAIAL